MQHRLHAALDTALCLTRSPIEERTWILYASAMRASKVYVVSSPSNDAQTAVQRHEGLLCCLQGCHRSSHQCRPRLRQRMCLPPRGA